MRAAGPPDPPVSVALRLERTPSLADLGRPAPARARALAAATASLKRDAGLCGDRGRTAAQHALDAALDAAKRPQA
jgi:hypothetical protein